MRSDGVSGHFSCPAACCSSEDGAEHGYVQISQVLVWLSGIEKQFHFVVRSRVRDAVTGALLSLMMM